MMYLNVDNLLNSALQVYSYWKLLFILQSEFCHLETSNMFINCLLHFFHSDLYFTY